MSSLTKLSMVVCAAACLLLAPGLRAQTPPPGVPEPQAPESRIPAPETPGAQAPGTQVPDIEAPEAQAPEIEAPPGQLPAVAPLASRLGVRVELEPQAIDLLKAMSHRLASARTMTFTAVATYESMARTGEPLAYTTISEVALKRPNMLRVITPGDFGTVPRNSTTTAAPSPRSRRRPTWSPSPTRRPPSMRCSSRCSRWRRSIFPSPT